MESKAEGAYFDNGGGINGYANRTGIDSVTVTATPEPSVMALLVTGLFGLLAYAWRKRR